VMMEETLNLSAFPFLWQNIKGCAKMNP